MSEPNSTHDHADQTGLHAPYLTLFLVLLNYTAMEYIYARFHTHSFLASILIGVALFITIITAVLAVMFNLHFNRKWVYITMVPAILLGFLPVPLILGLMILAITKATLVGFWFMHLKYEGKWVYYFLVPAGLLAIIFTTALYPDISMQPSPKEQELQEEDLTQLSPTTPQPVTFQS